ncbi:MAG: 3-oxoacyl-[acyl-carrier protein] reductase [uncultured Thermomicrobiales bacterium]|uniref:3-oxoacyl-[acyl-carrier protein] reductase n=1 Tax=uncultured Thermomicrobiales bacterium TaxID=1645740 RepID=A0A6J4UQY4_9BACT|nr:MAG: 3-oxoacyl-[acyl-carrier protein] reductase [uncultured Thermomicrobiales bacterium]
MAGRFSLEGKVALITGGASGIGAATARAFVEQGARVVIGDLNEAAGEALATELGEGAVFTRLDVTSGANASAAVALARERFGRLDSLVNCAGIGFVGNVEETPEAEWAKLFAVNVTGTFLTCAVAVPVMLAQEPRGGTIINIGSVAGLVAVSRRFAYGATKGAVVALSKSIAVDYAGTGVRCNCICPGTIYSPFVESYLDRFHKETKEQTIAELHARQPVGRMGRPDEVADLAAYLASDAAEFITGAALTIDGGLTAR